jgi:hypothetical protein
MSKTQTTASENMQMRLEFLEEKNVLLKVPEGKSNNRFLGHIFAKIVMDHIMKHLSMHKYRLVLGPLWLKHLEWVEWDGAIARKESKAIYECYYEPREILALFEFKISGIYGRKTRKEGQKGKTVQEVVFGIRENFKAAQDLGAAKERCFYISLHERKTKPEADLKENPPINYYAEAKKLESDALTCILFNSTTFEKDNPDTLDDWEIFVEKLKKALPE